jgi:hypothetical protein
MVTFLNQIWIFVSVSVRMSSRFEPAVRRSRKDKRRQKWKSDWKKTRMNTTASTLDKVTALTYAKDLNNGILSGDDLKQKVEKNILTNTERRKITKLAKKLKGGGATGKEGGSEELTERQKLRRIVKEKKMLPKLDKDTRRKKYLDQMHEKESSKFVTCLGCRKKGHYLKDCPEKPINGVIQTGVTSHICYYCGSRDHALRDCSSNPDPYNKTNLPFAKCFICQQTGHLSKYCLNNEHGLYPKGGCCHVCGELTHLAKNCPLRPNDDEKDPKGDDKGEEKSDEKEKNSRKDKKKKNAKTAEAEEE